MTWTASQRKYQLSEKGKLSRKKYQESSKAKESRKKYQVKRKARLLELNKNQETKPDYAVKTLEPTEVIKKIKSNK